VPWSVAEAVAGWLAENSMNDLEAHMTVPAFEEIATAVYASVREKAQGWGEAAAGALDARYDPYDRWDRVLFPIRQQYDIGENDVIQLGRMSPLDAHLLAPAGAAQQRAFYDSKIKGTAFNHFGAFLELAWRQNDYLWGRLDAAERLLSVLLESRDPKVLAPDAVRLFTAITDEERLTLSEIDETFQTVQQAVARLPAGQS
jgi:hypothetical protein